VLIQKRQHLISDNNAKHKRTFAASKICILTGDDIITSGTHPTIAMPYVATEDIKKHLQNLESLA